MTDPQSRRHATASKMQRTKELQPIVKETYGTPATTEKPEPVGNEHPAIWSLVIEEMQARDQLGRKRYGTPLQAHNGRDALVDAYQEALDLAVYLRQAIYERDGS